MGATPHRLAKEASLLNLWGLSPATIKSVAAFSVPMLGKEINSGATCATSRSRCASSSTISAERASQRRATETEREFGGRRHVTRAISETEACGHRDELLRREPTQTVAKFLRCRHAQALELVGGLRPGLNGGAVGRAQGPDHLHAPVAALGHARRFAGQNRSCGALGVGGVGLLDVTARASPLALRALYLQHLDSPSPQVAGELKAP